MLLHDPGLAEAQLRALLAERARRQAMRAYSARPERIPEIVAESSLVLNPDSPFCDLMRPARYKVYWGGRGAAKSYSFAEALVRMAAHKRLRVLCTREYQNSIKESVHRLLCDTVSRLGLGQWFRRTNETITSRAGGEFIFKGLHSDIEGIKSMEAVDIVWIEEGQSASNNSLKILFPTIRKENSEIWISFNRNNDNDPVYVRFVTHRPPNAIVHKVNFDTNPFLTGTLEAERQDALRLIREADNDDEREAAQNDYDHIWLGEAKRISREIILSGKCVVEDFPSDLYKKADRLLFGADWGFAQDPTALIRGFILDGCLYIEYEASGVGIDFAGHMVDDRGELEQLFDTVPESRNWPIKADGARPETISFMRGKGFSVTAAEKWKGSVEDGIAHLRGFKKIIINPRCKRTAQESRLYAYKVDRITGEVLPIIIDKNNHCIDAIRYSLDGYIQRRGDLGIWARLGQE